MGKSKSDKANAKEDRKAKKAELNREREQGRRRRNVQLDSSEVASFAKVLLAEGLELKEVDRDGNCFFRSLCDQVGTLIPGACCCLAPWRFPSPAAPASSRGPGEGGGSAPWDPGLGSVVVSMLSRTAPWPLVDMAVYGELVPSRATRRRWLQGGSVRERRCRSSAVLAGALAAER